MSKHVIFVIHGMGSATADWSKDAIKKFKANASAIKYPLSLKDDFEFIEINYDHLFLQYITQHNKNAQELSTYMTTAQLGGASSFFRGLFEYSASSLSNEDFVVSALGDVYLYRLAEYSNVVRSFVIQEITSNLASRDHPQWSVIAHSLGTRVIHDSLDEFLSKETNRDVFGKPVGLAMIANVVHLLAYSPSTLWKKTRVYPHRWRHHGGCYRYVNALHPADPFCWVREFDPTPDWGDNAEYSSRYLKPDIKLKELTRGNSHSFEGYLENPRVSAAICWALGTGDTAAPAYDEQKLIARQAKYAQSTLGGNAEKAWKKAQKLKMQRDLTSLREFVAALHELEAFIKNFGESLTD